MNTLKVGDVVRKGNGKTLYRVWCVQFRNGHMKASVVKLTTKNDPKFGCFYRFEEFTLVKSK